MLNVDYEQIGAMVELILDADERPRCARRAPFEAALVRELVKALEAADWIRVDLWVTLLMRWGWR